MHPISVCIIAKNEESRIERCLSSVKPYGFEIVVVDTGSTDRTKEKRLTAAEPISFSGQLNGLVPSRPSP